MVRSIVSSVQKYDNSLWLPEAFAPFTKNPYFKMLIFFLKSLVISTLLFAKVKFRKDPVCLKIQKMYRILFFRNKVFFTDDKKKSVSDIEYVDERVVFFPNVPKVLK
jgi:hypothetical protein